MNSWEWSPVDSEAIGFVSEPDPPGAGCPCGGDEPSDVLRHLGHSPVEAQIVQESHFSMRLIRCPGCRRLHLRVSGEMIDWSDNGPSVTVYHPVSEAMGAALREAGEERAERVLQASLLVGRSVVVDYETQEEGPTRVSFQEGFSNLVHD